MTAAESKRLIQKILNNHSLRRERSFNNWLIDPQDKEQYYLTYPYIDIHEDTIKYVMEDCGYNPGKTETSTKFFFVVDRLDLLTQANIRHPGGGFNLDGKIKATNFVQKKAEEHTTKPDVAAKSVMKLPTDSKNNTVKDFEFPYFDDIDDALIEGLSQNQDFFSLLLSNDEIKKQVLGIFTEEIYKSLRDT